MITLRKLRLLPPDTRLRKIVRMLDGFVYYRTVPESRYLSGLFNLIQEILPRGVPAASTAMISGENHERSLRIIDNLRYELRSLLNIAIGDWDLQAPSGYGTDDGSQHVVARPAGSHSVSVYMESIRSPFNAGSIIRSAVALGVSRIGMSPDCPQSNHPRLLRTARGAEQAVSIQRFAIDALADDWKPLLALEVGGHHDDAARDSAATDEYKQKENWDDQ